MSVIKVIEIVSSSPTSWEDAARTALREASQSLRHIKGVDVIKQTAQVNESGEIIEFRVTMHLAFEVEHHSHFVGAGGRKQ